MSDEQAMARAIVLAQQGAGAVSPNPRVGCVIMRDGAVLAEGWHHRFGAVHAEVDAVQNAKGSIEGATIVVNLEPCSHYGKTPPCADLLIEKNVRRVVVGTTDPNPQVAGKGIERLRQAGIEVVVGVLEAECRHLNRFFMRHIVHGIPYVVLKAAQSLDGCIATATGQSFWITCEASRRRVHELRGEVDAVLVGANTVRYDNPELTVRLAEGRHPIRVVLDAGLQLPLEKKLFRAPLVSRTLVVCSAQQGQQQKARLLRERGVELVEVECSASGAIPPDAIVQALGARGISSVLVEGGAGVYASFLQAGVVDEIQLFCAPLIIGNGLRAFGQVETEVLERVQRFTVATVERVGTDVLIRLVP